MKRFKRRVKLSVLRPALGHPAACLLVLSLCFLAGLLLGRSVAGASLASEDTELFSYLTDCLALEELHVSSFGQTLLLFFRYPVLAFCLGFASIGVVLLPVTAAAQGFFLSFSVSCFGLALGKDGILLSAAILGIRCLVVLPCFFYLAVQSMVRCGKQYTGHRTDGAGISPLLWHFFVCVVLLLMGALLEYVVSPVLLEGVQHYFTA